MPYPSLPTPPHHRNAPYHSTAVTARADTPETPRPALPCRPPGTEHGAAVPAAPAPLHPHGLLLRPCPARGIKFSTTGCHRRLVRDKLSFCYRSVEVLEDTGSCSSPVFTAPGCQGVGAAGLALYWLMITSSLPQLGAAWCCPPLCSFPLTVAALVSFPAPCRQPFRGGLV